MRAGIYILQAKLRYSTLGTVRQVPLLKFNHLSIYLTEQTCVNSQRLSFFFFLFLYFIFAFSFKSVKTRVHDSNFEDQRPSSNTLRPLDFEEIKISKGGKGWLVCFALSIERFVGCQSLFLSLFLSFLISLDSSFSRSNP